jgi:hypothetical protein
MSSLEATIRDALRSEAGRLREVRPLSLEPALPLEPAPHLEPAPRRPARARWTWLAPATAAALVIVLAIALVIVRGEQNGPAVPAQPRPSAPSTFPRYYMALEQMNNDGNAARLVVGDSVTGKLLAAFNAPAGGSFETTTQVGAADDRTFIVAGSLGQRKIPYEPYPTNGPTAWYQVRISPGSASRVTMTRLPISGRDADMPVMDAALSGDGRYLAVALGEASTTRQELQVYSVLTGQLLHTWSLVTANFLNYAAINTLTWVDGDTTVAFSWRENNHWEVRTLALSAPGTSLASASQVIWSLYDPPPPHGVEPSGTPMSCGFAIAADAHAVMECLRYISKTGVSSPNEWQAYAIPGPAKPSVVAVVPQPVTTPNSNTIYGRLIYASAREVISYFATPEPPARNISGPMIIQEYLASGHNIRELGTGTIASPWVVW